MQVFISYSRADLDLAVQLAVFGQPLLAFPEDLRAVIPHPLNGGEKKLSSRLADRLFLDPIQSGLHYSRLIESDLRRCNCLILIIGRPLAESWEDCTFSSSPRPAPWTTNASWLSEPRQCIYIADRDFAYSGRRSRPPTRITRQGSEGSYRPVMSAIAQRLRSKFSKAISSLMPNRSRNLMIAEQSIQELPTHYALNWIEAYIKHCVCLQAKIKAMFDLRLTACGSNLLMEFSGLLPNRNELTNIELPCVSTLSSTPVPAAHGEHAMSDRSNRRKGMIVASRVAQVPRVPDPGATCPKSAQETDAVLPEPSETASCRINTVGAANAPNTSGSTIMQQSSPIPAATACQATNDDRSLFDLFNGPQTRNNPGRRGLAENFARLEKESGVAPLSAPEQQQHGTVFELYRGSSKLIH